MHTCRNCASLVASLQKQGLVKARLSELLQPSIAGMTDSNALHRTCRFVAARSTGGAVIS